jgi:hypothetical protein
MFRYVRKKNPERLGKRFFFQLSLRYSEIFDRFKLYKKVPIEVLVTLGVALHLAYWPCSAFLAARFQPGQKRDSVRFDFTDKYSIFN